MSLLQHFFKRLKLRSLLWQYVRFDQRNNRYTISESLLALLYPIILGLGRIETTRLLKHNGVFQYLTGLPSYPDPTTLRRFLIRFGEAGIEKFLKLHEELRLKMLQRPNKVRSLIFDWDTTVLTVYGKQQGAVIGYNPKKRGRPSYLPLLCFEGNTRDCFEASYHPGNTNAASVILPRLQKVFAKAPKDTKEIRIRADSAFYDHKIIEVIEANKAFYAIPAKLTKPLKEKTAAARYRKVSGNIYAAEFRYQPDKWNKAKRFIAIRRPLPEEPSWQLTLWNIKGYSYQVIVTNLGLSPLNTWRFYNNRAEAELIIRELKEAYAMGKIPSAVWEANVAYFHLVVFSYNLLNWFKRLCVAPEWEKLTLQTLRNRLLLVPAELVRPQGKPLLRMPKSYPYKKQFLETQKRIARFRLT